MSHDAFSWGALGKISPDRRLDAAARYREIARLAVRLQVPDTLRLPAASVTAYHEAGHAVLYAALDNPPSNLRIWPVSAADGGGYAGECLFPADAPPIRVHPVEQPHEAIQQSCIILAGWVAEITFASDRFKLGSSLDEVTLAGGLIAGAAQALGLDRERLHEVCCAVTHTILRSETVAVSAIQRRLVAEGRLRGHKLAELLAQVRHRNITELVLSACRSTEGIELFTKENAAQGDGQ